MPFRAVSASATSAVQTVIFGLLGLLAFCGSVTAAEGRADIVGKAGSHVIVAGETLLDVAWEHDLGFVEILAANPGIDVWLPQPGTVVRLPTAHILPDSPREGVVINLADMRLYRFGPDGAVASYPIGIGQDGAGTPLGRTKIVRKQKDPAWFPTPETRADRPYLPVRVAPGPNNPLGQYALYLGWPTYLIHGTNNPWAIGRRVSRGCIRLYPQDIERLFPAVPVGSPVTVVDQPVKVGWRDGRLYLEVHPSQTQADQIEFNGSFTREPLPDLVRRIVDATSTRTATIDWEAVDRAAAERRGIPVQISVDPVLPSPAAMHGLTPLSRSHRPAPPSREG